MIGYFGDIDSLLESNDNSEYNLYQLEQELNVALKIQENYNELLEYVIVNESVIGKIWQWIKDLLTKAKNFFTGLFKSKKVKELNTPQAEKIVQDTAEKIIETKGEEPKQQSFTTKTIDINNVKDLQDVFSDYAEYYKKPVTYYTGYFTTDFLKSQADLMLISVEAGYAPGEISNFIFEDRRTTFTMDDVVLKLQGERKEDIFGIFLSTHISEIIGITNNGDKIISLLNKLLVKANELENKFDKVDYIVKSAQLAGTIINGMISFTKKKLEFAISIKNKLYEIGKEYPNDRKVKTWMDKAKRLEQQNESYINNLGLSIL